MASTENTPDEEGYTIFRDGVEKKIIPKKSGEIGGTDDSENGGTDNKYRMTFYEDNNPISPWHDIPLKTTENGKKDEGIYNFICEIPKYTKPKMEINTKFTKVWLNPIEQDIKKGKPREYHGPIYWNYGCLPQTWENPDNLDDERHKGDNDPLDVVEIGDGAMKIGEIAPVKVLGILAMIDEGEVDWKVIAIRTDATLTIEKDNPKKPPKKATNINELKDVPKEVLSGIREWFRWYKTPDSNRLNKFGLNEEFQKKEYAIKIIKETNDEYKQLLENGVDKYTNDNVKLLGLTRGNQKGGMRKRRTSRRTKRKRNTLKKNKRTKRKRKRNTSKKSRRTRKRTRRH